MNAKLQSSRPLNEHYSSLKSFNDYLNKRVCKSMFLYECSSDKLKVSQIIKELENWNGKISDLPIIAL